MAKAQTSAGILLYRRAAAGLEVLLVHPGGPYFARKDAGAWSIPKGMVDPGEDVLVAARREFAEETGHPAPNGEAIELGEVRLRSGKHVVGFALEGDLDVATIVSNTFEIPWPPRSGKRQSFPEVDRGQWFSLAQAREKLNEAQAAFLDRLPPD
ncbi:NUDIX domain-containing protein [Gordonia hydrophobica]|uniref:NUDIX domain-containing protein n=1 Tax=Gordonia hydrophobica TaxID=40516 RepID=A0ABZ2U034_9ACTN|nr:NUDIX domain-containing protein [Gordonia hydrophobica]MBM7366189.1 putative NUDIX family NTP pyrophosphohydrolase [Gordonia hydrophobica]